MLVPRNEPPWCYLPAIRDMPQSNRRALEDEERQKEVHTAGEKTGNAVSYNQ